MYVLPAARGTGLGSALLTAVVDEARRRGHVRLEIWSDKLLVDAHRLYERHGARIVAERVNDDPDAATSGASSSTSDAESNVSLADVTAADMSGDCPRTCPSETLSFATILCRFVHTGDSRRSGL